MSPLDTLLRLRAIGATLRLDGNDLRVSAPRGAMPSDLLAQLKANKEAILELLRSADVGESSRSPSHAAPILKRQRGDGVPLSFAQERMWFLDQLEPGSARYSVPAAFELRGRVSVEALRGAFDDVVGRHEILRTSYAFRDGHPLQRIHPSARSRFEVVDLSGLDDERRAEALENRIAEHAAQPFDLRAPEMMRVKLIGLEPERHVLLVCLHHIACDGWSVAVLMREVVALYLARLASLPSPLSELALQYADYASWQREWLSGEVLDAQVRYWRERLAGAAVLELPTDHPRPPQRRYRGRHHRFHLPAAIAEGIRALGRTKRTTSFITLAAAFNVLLHRYCGQVDITVGTPIANRTRLELEPLVGFFVNTLVLRTDLSGQPTFSELLMRVRDAALGAYEHQDLPFERLVRELDVERNPSRHPVFDVMFVLEERGAEEGGRLQELRIEPLETETGTAKFDLTLSLRATAGGLVGEIEYDVDLFEGATIERMAAHFEHLLAGVVHDPDLRIGDLPMLSQTERSEVLEEWNARARVFPRDTCVHELFEEQARKTPDAIALELEGHAISYRALDEKAAELARELRASGVGPDVLVGLCADRSLDAVIGMLGILKAGGAYLPLDPSYPWERVLFMLENAGIALLVTQERALRGPLPSGLGTFFLDRHSAEAPDLSRTPRGIPALGNSRVTPQNLAYAIYTSGSSGVPKGVLLHHRGLVNLCRGQAEALGVTPEDRILQFAPSSFDASLSEIGMALTSGATLVLIGRDIVASADRLEHALTELGITLVTLPPSLLAVMQGKLPTVRTLLAAGERCGAELVARWGIGRSFVNAYGPTEITVCATMKVCDPMNGRAPSIGGPLQNTRVYALDRGLGPVPTGTTGELCVGGAGVARGYLGRSALTAEKFLPDPFSTEPGARMYRTGDHVRWLSGAARGELEYVGRRDDQVKVRGFRIELGEVEAALGTHEAVHACAVIVREDRPGDRRLVAYTTPLELEGGPSTRALREHLAAHLPGYMVPSTFVELATMPLTSSGKVDRKALPAPGGERAGSSVEYAPPRNPTEEKLAEIVGSVLGLKRVGIHDDFFTLGGHSLLAAALMSRVESAFGQRVPLQSLYADGTIAGLADSLDGATGAVELDLEAEAVLDPSVRVPQDLEGPALRRATAPNEALETVLLTGATGLVGAYLCRALLQRTRARVCCVVRATNSEEAKARLIESLRSRDLLEGDSDDRLVAFPGDLAEPRLGLSPAHYAELCGSVSRIYHSGAEVNFLRPYARLKRANVTGTEEVLRLATTTRLKQVHYVSTLSVFSPFYEGRVVSEGDAPAHPTGFANGYAQSKWVAERLVDAAGSRGIPVAIYRLGAVTGDSATGVSSGADFVTSAMRGCLELGACPDVAIQVDMTPVDYVSAAIAELSFMPLAIGKTFHLVNPAPAGMAQIVEASRSVGAKIDLVPYDQWLDRLRNAPNNALRPFLPTFAPSLPSNPPEPIHFECERTLEALDRASIGAPDAVSRLTALYVRVLTASVP